MAESVMLTPEEQRWIKPSFDQYDLEDSNIVMGERSRPSLEKTASPPPQLSQIWQIVDTDNRGFLDYDGFAKVSRLVYHSQHGMPSSPRLANIPAGMPDFNRGAYSQSETSSAASTGAAPAGAMSPASSAQPLAAFSTGGSTFSANGETRIPPSTTADKKRYGGSFDRSVAPGDAFIGGAAARDIFSKARSPQETLGKVWALIDVDGRGKLTKNEFVVAMHLIQSLITKAMPNSPSASPASWQPWSGVPNASQHARQGSITNTSNTSNTPNMAAGTAATAAAVAGANSMGAGPPRVASVAIAPKERAQFDAIFDSLDTGRTGILGPTEAVPVLTKSGLSEDVLARVWDLADTRSRGQLDKGDFALAMHFVKAKLNGQESPDQVSPGAGDAPSSQPAASLPSNHINSQPQSQPTGQQQSQATGQQNNQPATPAPRGAPVAAARGAALSANATGSQVPPPAPPAPHAPHRAATSAGSLNDLVSLDNAVFKPLEPAKPRRVATESDATKFVPTTSFGQQSSQQHTREPHLQSRSTGQPSGSQSASQQTPQGASQQTTQSASQPSQQTPQGASQGAHSQPSMQPSAPSMQEAAHIESQIAANKAQQARANEELATVLKEKADLESKLKSSRVTYDNGTKEVHGSQQQIKAAREEIKQLERDIASRTSGLDAIKTQHAEEKQTLDASLADKQRLVEQQQTHDDTLASVQREIAALQEQHKTHRDDIAQHESRMTSSQGDIEAARWQRQQSQNEVEQHRRRAQQAKEAAEALARQAQEEAAATAKAQAEAQAAAELAEKQIASAREANFAAGSAPAGTAGTAETTITPGTTATPGMTAPTGTSIGAAPATAEGGEQPSQPAQSQAAPPAPAAQQAAQHAPHAHMARSSSTGSATDSESVSRNPGIDTPRTSPPTSEAHYASAEPNMPTFTSPMQRPQSTSSSVVNNPPQSVRGDLGSEPSERPTPEFPPMGMPDVGGSPLDLARDASFEFVDAQSTPGAAMGDLESSDDDEGPENAIPTKYGERSPLPPADDNRDITGEPAPPMPGSFPSEGLGEELPATQPSAQPTTQPSNESNSQESQTTSSQNPPEKAAHISAQSTGRGPEPQPPQAASVHSQASNQASNQGPAPVPAMQHAQAQAYAQTGLPPYAGSRDDAVPAAPASTAPNVPAPTAPSVSAPTAPNVSATAPSVSATAPGAPTSAPVSAPTSAAPSAPNGSNAVRDEFDEFDDLEEAKEDEGEDESASFEAAPPGTGPDEWQQSFARNNGSVVSVASHQGRNDIMPFTQPMPAVAKTPQESRELAELTSMGFTVEEARAASDLHGHNLSEATNYLLDNMR